MQWAALLAEVYANPIHDLCQLNLTETTPAAQTNLRVVAVAPVIVVAFVVEVDVVVAQAGVVAGAAKNP